MAKSPSTRNQGGVALVGFAFALIPLLALVGLLVDVGTAGYISGRLEAVADVAALEGPAGWRSPDDPAWCIEIGVPGCDPTLAWADWNADRRVRANVIAARSLGIGDTLNLRVRAITAPRLTADESLDDPSLRTNIAADPLTTRLDSPQVFLPNAGDAAAGDLVGGTWLGTTPTLVASCVSDSRFEAFDENCRYERADFVPGELLAPADDRRAFLARLRFTGETPIDDVASNSGALSVLFGRLTDTGLRQNGIAVRSTAIADARPALAAGRAGAVPGLPGAAPVVIDAAFWATVPLDTETTFQVAGDTLFVGGTAVGRILANPNGVVYLGDAVVSGLVLPPLDGSFAYLGLYRTAADAIDRVTGFANVTLAESAGGDIVITKLRSSVASGNSSAVAGYGLAGLDAAVAESVFQDYRQSSCLADDLMATVCVAVLVR